MLRSISVSERPWGGTLSDSPRQPSAAIAVARSLAMLAITCGSWIELVMWLMK